MLCILKPSDLNSLNAIIHSTSVKCCFCFASVHLWRYRGGYPALTEVMTKLRENKVRPHMSLVFYYQCY